MTKAKRAERYLRPQAGGPTLKPTRTPIHAYKCRRAGGELWRLMEYRQVTTKRNATVYRWVCIAIGTKRLKDVAFRLNLLP